MKKSEEKGKKNLNKNHVFHREKIIKIDYLNFLFPFFFVSRPKCQVVRLIRFLHNDFTKWSPISLRNLSSSSLIIIFLFVSNKNTHKDVRRTWICRCDPRPGSIHRYSWILNWNIFWMSIILSSHFFSFAGLNTPETNWKPLFTYQLFFALIKINWKSRKIVNGISDLPIIRGLAYNWNERWELGISLCQLIYQRTEMFSDFKWKMGAKINSYHSGECLINSFLCIVRDD